MHGGAVHPSFFKETLPLIQPAMMLAESVLSRLFDRSISSAGVVPVSSLIGSRQPSALLTRKSRRGVTAGGMHKGSDKRT